MLPGHPQGPHSTTLLFFQELCSAPCHLSVLLCFLPGRSTLSRCCNAPSFLFTTQKNTPLGTKLKYEVDTSGIYHINQEIFRMFPKVLLRAGRARRGPGPPHAALRGRARVEWWHHCAMPSAPTVLAPVGPVDRLCGHGECQLATV